MAGGGAVRTADYGCGQVSDALFSVMFSQVSCCLGGNLAHGDVNSASGKTIHEIRTVARMPFLFNNRSDSRSLSAEPAIDVNRESTRRLRLFIAGQTSTLKHT